MYWGLFSEGKLKVETENLSCTNPNLRKVIYVIKYCFNRHNFAVAHCPTQTGISVTIKANVALFISGLP